MCARHRRSADGGLVRRPDLLAVALRHALHDIPSHVADDQRARSLGVDRGHAANIPARRDGVVTHDRLPDPGGPTQHLVGSIQEMLRCDVERVGDRLGVRCCNSYDLSDPPVTISTCNRNRTGWGWRS